jgi:2',3'-cyclic-nucleotide 2'-phosphodiesterase (5'-nucleotidase family)
MLVLDAGAALLNDRDPARQTRGKISIELMNLLGYDAMALGLLDVAPLHLDELRQRIGEAKFPVLSANTYVTATNELLTKPYVVLQVADHHVGILGLTDIGSTDEVVIKDPVAAARERVPELQRQADIIIVLSHAGLEADRQIAEQVPGIAVIVGAHGQRLEEPFVAQATGTVIYSADASTFGHAGENMGMAHLAFDKTGQMQKQEWQRLTLNADITDDPQVLEWLARTPTP